MASEIAASETTSSLLSQIQGDGNDGKVQSCTGGLLRLQLGSSFFLYRSFVVFLFFWGWGGARPSWLSFLFLFFVFDICDLFLFFAGYVLR